jgi:hypothetical protein
MKMTHFTALYQHEHLKTMMMTTTFKKKDQTFQIFRIYQGERSSFILRANVFIPHALAFKKMEHLRKYYKHSNDMQ